MSVEIRWHGRFGNHVFQYAAARLFAQDNRLQLISQFLAPGFLEVTEPTGGLKIDAPEIVLTDGDAIFGKHYLPARYVFNGFFQDASWYYDRKQEVEKMFILPPVESVNENDLVMNVRLGDYWAHNIVIDPSWYVDLLPRLQFDKLYIVTDEANPEYLSHFKRYRPIIRTGRPVEDWHFLRSFRRIVSSNSTYCWWACFFSQASVVYTFRRWIDNPNAKLSAFPRSVQVDGRFFNEVVQK